MGRKVVYIPTLDAYLPDAGGSFTGILKYLQHKYKAEGYEHLVILTDSINPQNVLEMQDDAIIKCHEAQKYWVIKQV